METTGDRLRHLRESRNLSQADVADTIGVERTTYAKYETNKNKPSRKLNELAELFHVSVDYLLCLTDNPIIQLLHTDKPSVFSEAVAKARKEQEYSNEVPLPVANWKIPIIGRVKCGYNGFAYELLDGYVLVDGTQHGDIKAFRCYGDSMSGIGIYDGDIAIVRVQEDVECGELAIVTIDKEEGTLKRIRRQEDAIILESANPAYPPRVFTGKAMNSIRIVGKVIEIRRQL